MKESEYKPIREKLKKLNSYDGILKKNIFINWFFLLKPHPFFLKKYKKFDKSFLVLIFILIKNFFKLSITFIINLFKKSNYAQDISDKNFDYVFISHHISNKKIFENDPYFQSFYTSLKKKNKNIFIIYLNHNIKIIDHLLSNKKNYFFLNQEISLKKEFKFYKKIFSLSLFYFKHQKFSLKEKLIILGEVLNLDTLNNIKINFEIENLFNLINFKNLICTFEGYNFEKIIFSRSKNKDKNIRNIGYQHASIIQNQDSIFEYQDTTFFPDKILTTGKYYKNLFEKKLLKKVEVQVVGSNKIDLNIIQNIKKENYCVVLPEAILSECEILFKFSLKYSKIFDNLKFIWRLHPLMNIDDVLNKLSINKNSLDNIIISSNSDHDFLISKYSLYRGSSSVFNSLKYSSYPIYLDYGNAINIDPIYDLKLMNKVNSIEEFNLMTNKNLKSYNLKYLSDNVEKYFDEPNKYNLDIL